MRSFDVSKSVLLRQAVRVRRRGNLGALSRLTAVLLTNRSLWFTAGVAALGGLAFALSSSGPAPAQVAEEAAKHTAPTTPALTVAPIAAPVAVATAAVPIAAPQTQPKAVTAPVPPARTAPRVAATPTAVAPLARPAVLAPASRARVLSGVLREGTTLLAALQRAGLSRADLDELLDAAGKAIDFKRCRKGDRYRLLFDEAGRPNRLEYYGPKPVVLGAHRKKGKLVPMREPLRGERDVRVLHGRLRSSLESAVIGAGGKPVLASRLAELFAWDMDFNVDSRTGDSFAVAIERVKLPDGTWREGEIVGAEYHGQSGPMSAYRFREGPYDGYFDEAGRPLRRRYLAGPLPLIRITSKFGKRWHPILSRPKHHGGIDYAAPTGTPVWAMASGRVRFAARKGGYGNTVILEHADGVRTWYAHLSRFQKGMRKGARVTQKDVIGYVGSTGMSTGPHLHFGMEKGNKFFDPAKVRSKRALPLPKKVARKFAREMEQIRARLRAVHVARAPTAARPALAVR